MKKLELGNDVSIVMLTDHYPERTLYYDNTPVEIIGRGVALKIIPKDKEIKPIEIVMDKEQTKGIIKGLKLQMKNLKK